MNVLLNRAFLCTALTVCCLTLGACQSDKHKMIEAKPGMTIVCKTCYDEVFKLQQLAGSRFRGGHPPPPTIHQCPSCKTEMSTDIENGVATVKCAGCAPDGVACDKCLPLEAVPK